jgi:hypothetical protein
MALILNGSDTSAGDDAGLGYTAAEGLILTGQGTISDVTIKNDADQTVLSIPTGTTNVGIGTTSPSQKLHVVGSIKGSQSITIGTGGLYEAGSIYSDSNWGMIFRAKQASPAQSDFRWANSADTERMRITGDGHLLVATTNTSLGIGNTNTGFQVENNGTFLASRADNIAGSLNRNNDGSILSLRRSGTEVGTIGVTSSTTSYNTSSDYRLKENVSYTFDATTRLKQLKPARFNFIADSDNTVDGFLAHEVSSIVPEAITGTKDEVNSDGDPIYQGIDQSKLVPLLVKTIQEQQTVIEALEARITALEGS